MNSSTSKPHTHQIDTWVKQNVDGLSIEQIILLFGEAIHAIQKRTTATLSEVTLSAIFSRILHASQQKHPLLASVKIENKSLSLDKLLEEKNDLQTNEITDAFKFFLTELLTLLGNLTANILNQSLYQELFKVTADSVRAKTSHHGLRSIKNNSDRRNT